MTHPLSRIYRLSSKFNFRRSFTVTPTTRPRSKWLLASLAGITLTLLSTRTYLEAQQKVSDDLSQKKKYQRSEVAVHTSEDKGIWVTYQNGVYDVTEFVKIHPGGERILLAAGKAIDPYWAVFVIHQSAETKELLESYRIGDLLDAKEDPSFVPTSIDPGLQKLFENDPERHPSLIKRSERPCNAESASESLEPFVTPNQLFFVRHHLPVPKIDPESFVLEIEGPDIDRKYTLDDLKSKFEKTDVMATLQCAGNRRNDMHEVKPVKGLLWNVGAIGNAVWSGIIFQKSFKKRCQIIGCLERCWVQRESRCEACSIRRG